MFSYLPLPGMQLLFAWAVASSSAGVGAHSQLQFHWAGHETGTQQWSPGADPSSVAPDKSCQESYADFFTVLIPTPDFCPANSKPLLSWTLPCSSLKGPSLFLCGLTNPLHPIHLDSVFSECVWLGWYRIFQSRCQQSFIQSHQCCPNGFQSATAGAFDITVPVWETHSTCDFCWCSDLSFSVTVCCCALFLPLNQWGSVVFTAVSHSTCGSNIKLPSQLSRQKQTQSKFSCFGADYSAMFWHSVTVFRCKRFNE